jgi:transposase-like protein
MTMQHEYSWEVRERAEELYVVDGLTYKEVAEATGISVSQIERWGSEGGWADRRRQYRQTMSEIRRKTLLLREALIDKAITSLDPQDVYAISRLEATETQATELSKLQRELATVREEVRAIRQALEK